MKQQNESLARSWVVVMTAGSFFFYSFIQMTLFSTLAMKQHFKEQLSLDDLSAFGTFAVTFLLGTVFFLIPIGVLLDKVSVKKLILAMLVLVIVPDLAYCGGPSEALKIRAVATSMGINVIPHVWGTMFNFAAATHFLASSYREPGRSSSHPPLLEYDRTPSALRDEMFETAVQIRDREVLVPTGPGLGVNVDRKVMQAFLVRATENR